MSPYTPRHLAPADEPTATAPTGTSRRRALAHGLLGVSAVAGAATLGSAAASAAPSAGAIHGQDVSGWQGDVDWKAQMAKGSRFAYIKATEGRTYHSPTFSSQYIGATKAGLVRGGYHFARPDSGDPIEQCDAFLNGGGGWSDDGITLPGMLDLEGYPGLPANYGLSRQDLRTWISDFSNHYRANTPRRPILYTNLHWWQDNVGEWTPKNCPLFLASYSSSTPSTLPGRWWGWEMWQYSASGPFAGDSSVFFGTETQFERFVSQPDYGAVGI